MRKFFGFAKLFSALVLAVILLGCSLEPPPPTKQQAREAIQSFNTGGGVMGLATFGLMQDTLCMGMKITRNEIVEIKKASGSEYEPFPGKSKYVVTLVEEGQCGSGKFYLERDFLMVQKGLEGLPKDKSGKWSVWPLEYKYDTALLSTLEKSYDEISKKTNMKGWFTILLCVAKMEKNNRDINVWPRNEDHYYFEVE